MTYVAHDLLGKIASRIDSEPHSFWPFSDPLEARIVAVWIDQKDHLQYAVSAKDGRVGEVDARSVRLGSYVAIPRHEIVCPKCSNVVLVTYDQEPIKNLECYTNLCGRFDWAPPPTANS